jgi:putative ABC transport system ATP-binding protein
LSHTYRAAGLEPREVVHPIPLWEIEAGQQVLLRGISGSGKTTLLNILAGLLRPTTGDVALGGKWLYALDEAGRDAFRRRTIGYVFQSHYLIPTLTAADNVGMPLAFGGMAAAERRQRAGLMLERVGLDGHAGHRPAQLSVGQRLRVAIARAMVTEPALILADEPTAALDSGAAALVIDLLQSTCRERGATLLVASHDPSLDGRFDRAVSFSGGSLHPVPNDVNYATVE